MPRRPYKTGPVARSTLARRLPVLPHRSYVSAFVTARGTDHVPLEIAKRNAVRPMVSVQPCLMITAVHIAAINQHIARPQQTHAAKIGLFRARAVVRAGP